MSEPVCNLCSVSLGDRMPLRCGHGFCAEHIVLFLDGNGACPSCADNSTAAPIATQAAAIIAPSDLADLQTHIVQIQSAAAALAERLGAREAPSVSVAHVEALERVRDRLQGEVAALQLRCDGLERQLEQERAAMARVRGALAGPPQSGSGLFGNTTSRNAFSTQGPFVPFTGSPFGALLAQGRATESTRGPASRSGVSGSGQAVSGTDGAHGLLFGNGSSLNNSGRAP